MSKFSGYMLLVIRNQARPGNVFGYFDGTSPIQENATSKTYSISVFAVSARFTGHDRHAILFAKSSRLPEMAVTRALVSWKIGSHAAPIGNRLMRQNHCFAYHNSGQSVSCFIWNVTMTAETAMDATLMSPCA
jgi:hypothetical protein